MFYNNFFLNYSFNKDLALNYGFIRDKDSYILYKDLLLKDFFIRVRVEKEILEIEVFEKPDKEKYLPFEIVDSSGSLVNKIREEINFILSDIIKFCFVNNNAKEEILKFAVEKFASQVEYPWKKYPKYSTLKTNNSKKWYAVIMNLPYAYFLKSKNNKGFVDVLNIKLVPEKIEKLIDNKNFFPAYHMNKKHWLSIILDKNIDLTYVKDLLEESYNLVEK